MAKGLGRGLNAFFGEDEENAIEQVTKKSSKKEDNVLEKVIELKIDEIEPMLNQPRKVFNQEKMDENNLVLCDEAGNEVLGISRDIDHKISAQEKREI